jgi:hypothetical protein
MPDRYHPNNPDGFDPKWEVPPPLSGEAAREAATSWMRYIKALRNGEGPNSKQSEETP